MVYILDIFRCVGTVDSLEFLRLITSYFRPTPVHLSVIKMTVKPSNMKGEKRENEGISRYFQGYAA